MRGGVYMTCGPSSARSTSAVSLLSGKLTVRRDWSATDTLMICSPLQASGRKLR